MKAHAQYLRYLLRHKWYVLRAGLKTGAPLWRLIVHDWSKFRPREWRPYVRKFYGKPPALNPAYFDAEWREHEAERWKLERDRAFDRAWLHHQHANPHHWQHWVLREDSGATKVLPMPYLLVCEMVADWAGAGRAITGRWEVAEWYAKNGGMMMLHANTRMHVEGIIAAHFAAAPAPVAA